jgi:anti-anti-sigma regulatory factor
MKIHLEDYSQSHVVTFVDCLAILKKKALDKTTVKTFKEERRKEREEKQARKIVDVQVVVAIAIERRANREAMA